MKIQIDGKEFEAQPGQMVIQVADAAGIYIPRFCYHKKLSVAANCRMCLVEVEKAPKPLPACATPVAEGMRVFTRSKLAVEAQKATMEFLLINHPLDCPVCDQGGECPLQDQAMGYGGDVSRFTEKKRVVNDKDIGPLIETEMTRCIHCTRCVRFGQEIAGIMELGAVGRGEHMEIATYLGSAMHSEVSGNVIDLCPVGALTNKPYRFSARAWELRSNDGISPHDCIGTNINIQSLRGTVKRVLPRDNEDINECWLADRDRYSYEAINSSERLRAPLIRVHGQWRETDWESALEFTVKGLQLAIRQYGADQLAAVVAPTSTMEEGFLAQKLLRGLGSHNIDHRLRQSSFEDDDLAPLYPGLEFNIKDLETSKALLLVGSNLRKEQPLLALRVRKASAKGGSIMAINPVDYDFNFRLSNKVIAAPRELPNVLARIERLVCQGKSPIDGVETWARGEPSDQERAIAQALINAGQEAKIVLGDIAINHNQFAVLRALASSIADATGAAFGLLAPANSAGLWLAGCVPHRGPLDDPNFARGLDARGMFEQSRQAYLLLNNEPVFDCAKGSVAQRALQQADFVVALTPFDTRDTTHCDVLLPVATFAETSGTYVNCMGQAQSFTGAVTPTGQARPAWKVLRVLGNLLGVKGFDYVTSQEIRAELTWEAPQKQRPREWRKLPISVADSGNGIDLERIHDMPIYRTDILVRHAAALQNTTDNAAPVARINPRQALRLGIEEDHSVAIHQGDGKVIMPVHIDARVPEGCVYFPAGFKQTAAIAPTGMVRVLKD